MMLTPSEEWARLPLTDFGLKWLRRDLAAGVPVDPRTVTRLVNRLDEMIAQADEDVPGLSDIALGLSRIPYTYALSEDEEESIERVTDILLGLEIELRDRDAAACSAPIHCPCGCGAHMGCFTYGPDL